METRSEMTLFRGLLDVLIRAGLIAALAVCCFYIFKPFLNLMLWSLILAVTLYPLHNKLKKMLGDRNGLSATLIVTLAIIGILVPAYLLGTSLTSSIQQSLLIVKEGSFHVPPPSQAIADLPVLGKPLYGLWLQASTDLSGLVQTFLPQLKQFSVGALGKLAGIGAALGTFIISLIIAGIIMAYGKSGHRNASLIASRIAGSERGPHVAALCTATTRAVAQGVVGIAFIQTILVAMGFMINDVPGAGVLAIAVLLLGIAQLPASLVTLPVIAYVLATDGASATNIAFAIYVLIAGLADNILKPLLLGRGVEVPMPVILIGALGGMITSGIIGLFIGPILLAVAYQLFWYWVDGADCISPPDDQNVN
ncbi:AI-2E family transporter [Pseudomonas sp. NPDC098747]|uniref:AI-2E family transporter n=1 Tax=Pseudomonas sp. NPDC098747 TaxID=3364487 RepID=UPI00383A27BF